MVLIRLWLRWELRRRWRPLGGLALLVALSVGVVATAVSGALRATSAVDRLAVRTLPQTVAVLPSGNRSVPWDRVRALPQVAALSLVTESGVDVQGVAEDDERFTLPSDAAWMHTLERPVVLAGRLPDPTAADEMAVTPGFLDAHRLQLGSSLRTVLRAPGGSTLSLPTLRVVGVVRSTRIADAAGAKGRMELTPAYFRAFAAGAASLGETPYLSAYIRLRGGAADLPAFQRALHAIDQDGDLDLRTTDEELLRPRDVIGFEVRFLLAFAAAALLAAVLLLAQAVAREVSAVSGDVRTLGALGADRSRQLVVAASGPGLAGLVGVPVGVAASVPASRWFPSGTAGYYEPTPGILVDTRVLVGTLLLAPCLVVAGSWAVAALAWWRQALGVRPEAPVERTRSSPLAGLVRHGAPVTTWLGARMAWGGDAGRGTPGVTGLSGVAAGVLATAAALCVAAGIGEASTNPARFGATMDAAAWISDDSSTPAGVTQLLARAAADPDVEALSVVHGGATTAGTADRQVSLDVFGDDPVKGALPVVVTAGRMPISDDETLLGLESAAEVGAAVGAPVRVGSQQLRVTGLGFVPESWRNNYASGAWTTQGGWQRLFPGGAGSFGQAADVSFRPGAARQQVVARLNAMPGLDPAHAFTAPAPVQRIADLGTIRRLPLMFAAFLGLLTAGTLAHVLITALRRNRVRLALLRALGMTPRQTRATLAWQGALLAAAAVAVGVPLGVAGGRSLWRVVAAATPVQYAPPGLAGPLLLVPAALLVAWLALAWPGERAARARVADMLRAE